MRLIPILVLTILLASLPNVGFTKERTWQGYEELPFELLVWMKKCCEMYNVEPEFALAVAKVESSLGKYNFRTGQMGPTYWGPMGLHECFLKKWPIYDPKENILRGVITLRNTKSRAAKIKRLRKYNASCDRDYLKDVFACYAYYKDIKYFEKVPSVQCKNFQRGSLSLIP